MSARVIAGSAVAAASIAMLTGCGGGTATTFGAAHSPVVVSNTAKPGASIPGQSDFPGHTCIAKDKLAAETWVVTPTAAKYDSTAQNVCQQLFGSPKAFAAASGLPGGYVLRCTGTGYGITTQIFASSGASKDCHSLATVGYKVVES